MVQVQVQFVPYCPTRGKIIVKVEDFKRFFEFEWNTFPQHKANTEMSSTNKYQHQLMLFIKTAPFGIKSFPYLNERMSFFTATTYQSSNPFIFWRAFMQSSYSDGCRLQYTELLNSTSTLRTSSCKTEQEK